MTAEQGFCSSYKNLMDIDSDVTPMLVSTDVTGTGCFSFLFLVPVDETTTAALGTKGTKTKPYISQV
jgi:hypothetical protein